MSNPRPVFSRGRLLTAGVCVWAAAAVCDASPAHAETPLEIELQYVTDPLLTDCPSEVAFRAMVVEQLGYDPVRQTSAHRVLATARAAPGDISGSVHWRHSESSLGGEREMSGKTCKELARAMAFAVAVQVQLLVLQKQPSKYNEAASAVETDTDERATVTTPAATASAKPPPIPPPISAPATARARPSAQAMDVRRASNSAWSGVLGGGVGVRLRSEPTTTAEGRVFGAFFHGGWGGELSLGGTWPQHQDAFDDAGFRYWSWWGSAFGCVIPKPLVGCIGARFERLSARGIGLDAPRLAYAWVVEVGPRLAFAIDLTYHLRTALYAEARAVVAPAWVIVNDARVWKTPPWSLTLGLDVAAIWQ